MNIYFEFILANGQKSYKHLDNFMQGAVGSVILDSANRIWLENNGTLRVIKNGNTPITDKELIFLKLASTPLEE